MKNMVAIAVLIALEIVVIALLKVLGIVDYHSTLAVIIVIIFHLLSVLFMSKNLKIKCVFQ